MVKFNAAWTSKRKHSPKSLALDHNEVEQYEHIFFLALLWMFLLYSAFSYFVLWTLAWRAFKEMNSAFHLLLKAKLSLNCLSEVSGQVVYVCNEI